MVFFNYYLFKQQGVEKQSARAGLQRMYYFRNLLRFLNCEAMKANRHEELSERSEFSE